MRRTVTALLITLILAACGGDDPDASTSAEDDRWGPLAVGPASDAAMEALTHGTIRITDECVLLLEGENGAEVLLIWAANWTRWDPDDEAVLYAPFGNAPVRLRDGDRVSLGGGGASANEGGIGQQSWVHPPDPSCPMEQIWIVGEVVSAEPPA